MRCMYPVRHHRCLHRDYKTIYSNICPIALLRCVVYGVVWQDCIVGEKGNANSGVGCVGGGGRHGSFKHVLHGKWVHYKYCTNCLYVLSD